MGEGEEVSEHEMNVFDQADNKRERLTILNTKARSLVPKIDSLIDNFNQLACTLGIVTETWLADGGDLENKLEDLQDGMGISLLHKNRRRNHRGTAHGGVCILARSSKVKLTRFRYHNPANFKVLAAIAKLKGHSRKML